MEKVSTSPLRRIRRLDRIKLLGVLRVLFGERVHLQDPTHRSSVSFLLLLLMVFLKRFFKALRVGDGDDVGSLARITIFVCIFCGDPPAETDVRSVKNGRQRVPSGLQLFRSEIQVCIHRAV